MNLYLKQKQDSSEGGFTLVELLVSLGLFAVVMTLSAGATLTILDANAMTQSSSTIMTNLNIALDAMSREIRTGTGYSCGDTVTYICDNSNSFTFTTQEGVLVTYNLNASGEIMKTTPTGSVAITSPEITVTKLTFNGYGFKPFVPPLAGADLKQPLVRITLDGKAGFKQKLLTTFQIQTSVSQRLLDIRI
jgi:prepilin-type N-terminal cleavage/methylation domain-containing protein